MSVYKSEAIVLRRMKYSETSIIVDLLTRSHGVRSFIVNGVRSKRGKSAYFQYNQILDIVAFDKKEKLSRLKEYKLNHSFESLMTDVIKSTLGVFLLEVNKNVLKESTPTPELYDFIKKWLLELDVLPHQFLGNVPSLYILELCHYIGIYPMDNWNEQCPYFNKKEGVFEPLLLSDMMDRETSKILASFSKSSHADILQLKLPKQHRDVLLDELIDYLKIQMPHTVEIKSLDVLRAIF